MHSWLTAFCAQLALRHPESAGVYTAMPYALEAVFLTYFMFTLWLGLRVQRAWWLRITGAGPELPKQPGAVDFAAPTTLIDGRPHRARAAPDFSIAAWEPIPDARDAKVVRS